MASKRLNKRQLREQQELQELQDSASSKAVGAGQDDAGEAEAGLVEASQTSSDEVETAPSGTLFATLAENGDDDQMTTEDEQDINSAAPAKSKSRNRRKRNKKKTGGALVGAETEEQSAGNDHSSKIDDNQAASVDVATASPNPTKKKKKKAPSKASTASQTPKDGKKGTSVSEMSMEEFTALLATQANVKDGSGEEVAGLPSSSTTAAITAPVSSLRTQLALAGPNLDPSIELRRQFGAAAIKAYESEAGAGSNDGMSARRRALMQRYQSKIKSILVQPKDTWPPIARTFTGMSMEVVDEGRGGKVGAWKHSRAYREVQAMFFQAVASYDPNQLVALLTQYPWHIDTLLQLSDISRHQGDLGQASDFNERAIFAFEQTALPSFTSNLTSSNGPPMLNFNLIENRGFWLASHRHVNFLARRGTWRTALEWVKMILGLDPGCDQHGMLLWLDFLSIKSKQHAWFLKTLKAMEPVVAESLELEGEVIMNAKTPFDDDDKSRIDEQGTYRGAMEWYPGLAYNKALALRAVEEENGNKVHGKDDASTAALRLAVARHPQILCPLFDKIGITFPGDVPSTHALFSPRDGSPTANLLSQLYIARNESLWREPEITRWLSSTLKEAWPALEKAHAQNRWARAECQSAPAIKGIARHVLVSDLPDALRQSLIGLLPKDITSDSAKLDANDPVPPTEPGSTRYDDAYFSFAQTGRRNAQRGFAGGQALPPELLDGLDGLEEADVQRILAEGQNGGEGGGGWMQRLANLIMGNRAGADLEEESEDEGSIDENEEHARGHE